MKNNQEPLETLSEIRSIMERSTRFISLNGLSGVFAGIFAIIGAVVAYYQINASIDSNEIAEVFNHMAFIMFLFADAILVLVCSIGVAVFLSYRKAKKQGLSIWDRTAKRLLINLIIPLVTGGFFCLVLIYHGSYGLVAPAMLIFYGLALINSGKYTFPEIWYLGITEIALGLTASILIGYGLLFWVLGFGIAHIVYGAGMYFKYER